MAGTLRDPHPAHSQALIFFLIPPFQNLELKVVVAPRAGVGAEAVLSLTFTEEKGGTPS